MSEVSGNTAWRRKIEKVGDQLLAHPEVSPLIASQGVALVVPQHLIEIVNQLVATSSLADIMLPPGTVVAETFYNEDTPVIRSLEIKDSPDLAVLGFNQRQRSLELSLMYGYVSGRHEPHGRLSQILGVTLDAGEQLRTFRKMAAAVGAAAVSLAGRFDGERSGVEEDIGTISDVVREIMP